MTKELTIDSILKESFNGIPADNLSDDKLIIDDSYICEDSSTKYLQLFAGFLNEAYYRGYVVSSEIIKKLMDIISFEGYEYAIMNSYANTLLEYMTDTKWNDDKRPDYKANLLSAPNSIEFVNEYLKAIEDEKFEYDATVIPNYDKWFNRQTTNGKLALFRIINDPLNLIAQSVLNEDINGIEEYKRLKVVKDNDKKLFDSILDLNVTYESLVLLLDEEEDCYLDKLFQNITTIQDLTILVKTLYEIKNFNDYSRFSVPDSVNNNLRRLLELITVNITKEQLALIISSDYDLWKEFDENNPHYLNTLHYALSLYESNKLMYTQTNPFNFIFKIKDLYYKDPYQYARYAIFYLDCNTFCENIDSILLELDSNNLSNDQIKKIIDNKVKAIIDNSNKETINQLIKTYNFIKSNSIAKNMNSKIIYKYNEKEQKLESQLIDQSRSVLLDKYIDIFDSIKDRYLGYKKRPNLEQIQFGDKIPYFRSIVSTNSSQLINDIYTDGIREYSSIEEATYIIKYIDGVSGADSLNLNVTHTTGTKNITENIIYNTNTHNAKYIIGIEDLSNNNFIYCPLPVGSEFMVSLVNGLKQYSEISPYLILETEIK